jgi:hypothetical protein
MRYLPRKATPPVPRLHLTIIYNSKTKHTLIILHNSPRQIHTLNLKRWIPRSKIVIINFTMLTTEGKA